MKYLCHYHLSFCRGNSRKQCGYKENLVNSFDWKVKKKKKKKKFHKSANFIKLFWYYENENKRHVFHIHKEMVKENEEIMVKKIM